MNILGLIPARGGSKGVPGKNLRMLGAHPLLWYTVEAALRSYVGENLVLSTDSPEIGAYGLLLGLQVPFVRPAHLATDTAAMRDVVQHALTQVPGIRPNTLVVLMQPTSPLRRPEHIDRAIDILEENEVDSVVSVVQVPPHLSPDYVMQIEYGNLEPFIEGAGPQRRQDARTAYYRDGTVYVFRADNIQRTGTIYGNRCLPLILQPHESLSIDTEADWQEAERRIQGAPTL